MRSFAVGSLVLAVLTLAGGCVDAQDDEPIELVNAADEKADGMAFNEFELAKGESAVFIWHCDEPFFLDVCDSRIAITATPRSGPSRLPDGSAILVGSFEHHTTVPDDGIKLKRGIAVGERVHQILGNRISSHRMTITADVAVTMSILASWK